MPAPFSAACAFCMSGRHVTCQQIRRRRAHPCDCPCATNPKDPK